MLGLLLAPCTARGFVFIFSLRFYRRFYTLAVSRQIYSLYSNANYENLKNKTIADMSGNNIMKHKFVDNNEI